MTAHRPPRPAPSRVVIVTDFAAVRGGASGLALLQARLMADRGLPVTVFAGDSGGDPPEGVELVAVGSRRLLEQGRLSALARGLWNPAAAAALSRWIAARDDARTIYHVHGYHQTLSPAVLAPLQPLRKRTVLHAHDWFLACPNGAFFDYRAGAICARAPMSASCLCRNCDKRSYGQKLWRVARQAVQNRQTRRLFRAATTVLLHEDMRHHLTHPRPGRMVTVPNPAQPLLSAPAAPQGQRDFLYAGDIHIFKGVFLLAEAARRAGVPLRFAGDGVDRARLAAAYPEHRFEGWVDRAGLAAQMARARALVAPTLGPEPFGLAAVEALASGVPVVISDSMVLARQIAAAGAGERFAAGDAGALAGVLRRLAQDDGRVAALASRAPAAAQALATTPRSWCDRLLALYAEILGGPGESRGELSGNAASSRENATGS